MSLTLLICFLAVLTAPVMSQSCTGGKVYQTCGSPCTPTCENHHDPPICLTSCATGCFCPQGTVIHNDQCIDPSECPGSQPVQPPACINGKIYNTCGTACPLTCDNHLNQPIRCTLQCVQGCFCPTGMVEMGDTCVPPDQCPNAVTAPPTTPPPIPTCTNGKVFRSCGTACPRTCDNYQQQFLPCTRQCVIGCFCPSGLVEMGDSCVPPDQCPTATTTMAAPSQPVCTNGRIYETCGTACPVTCDNYRNPPRVCPDVCMQGCFCPSGLVQLGDTCVHSTSCPDAVTAPPTTPPPIPTCTNGKVFRSCGTACPRTCDNYQQQFLPCTRQCVIGCFCPAGLVEMGDSCVPPDQCPSTTAAATDPPTTAIVPSQETCINGKLFEMCGTACPLTCDNYNNRPLICSYQCVMGCFCPHGLVESGDSCVPPDRCPNAAVTTTAEPSEPVCTNGRIFEMCGTACPITCDNYRNPPAACPAVCVEGCFCPTGLVQLGDTCVPSTSCPDTAVTTTAEPSEPVCTNGRIFEMCGTACPITCDNYRNPPAGCLAVCVEGCFCPSGLVQLGDTCVPSTSCPDEPTQSPECPDGMEYRECGPLCRYTCESYFGTNPCFSLRCGPAGCYCPRDHVMADGQCMPAKLACQDTKPTTSSPVIDTPSPVLLRVKIRNTPREEFVNQQDTFLTSVKDYLSSRGYGNVQAEINSITQDEHLVVVIQLSSDVISAAQANELAMLLSEGSGALTLEIIEVTQVSDDDADVDDGVLSGPAIIGIAVGASVIGLILIILLSAILVVCIVNGKSNQRQARYREKTELGSINSNMPVIQDDFAKDKLVRESLSY